MLSNPTVAISMLENLPAARPTKLDASAVPGKVLKAWKIPGQIDADVQSTLVGQRSLCMVSVKNRSRATQALSSKEGKQVGYTFPLGLLAILRKGPLPSVNPFWKCPYRLTHPEASLLADPRYHQDDNREQPLHLATKTSSPALKTKFF